MWMFPSQYSTLASTDYHEFSPPPSTNLRSYAGSTSTPIYRYQRPATPRYTTARAFPRIKPWILRRSLQSLFLSVVGERYLMDHLHGHRAIAGAETAITRQPEIADTAKDDFVKFAFTSGGVGIRTAPGCRECDLDTSRNSDSSMVFLFHRYVLHTEG